MQRSRLHSCPMCEGKAKMPESCVKASNKESQDRLRGRRKEAANDAANLRDELASLEEKVQSRAGNIG